MSYSLDRCWSDRFMPDIRNILTQNAGCFLSVELASEQDDIERATDLIVNISGGQVAVRIRRDGYKKYRDWTIRALRRSGQKTELDKLREGFARWYLYLWTEVEKGTGKEKIVDWVLINLDRVRQAGILNKDRKKIPNKDGTTWFIAVSIPELKKCGCVISEFKAVTSSYQIPLFKVY